MDGEYGKGGVMERPYTSEVCRERILEFARTPNPELVEPGVRGAIIGCLNRIFSSDSKERGDNKRHTVLGYLFGDPNHRLRPMSTKELNNGQWYALARWMDLSRTVDAKWLPCQHFMTEALFVLHASMQKHFKDEQEMMAQLGMEETDG